VSIYFYVDTYALMIHAPQEGEFTIRLRTARTRRRADDAGPLLMLVWDFPQQFRGLIPQRDLARRVRNRTL
jgi:hypothetical protein